MNTPERQFFLRCVTFKVLLDRLVKCGLGQNWVQIFRQINQHQNQKVI